MRERREEESISTYVIVNARSSGPVTLGRRWEAPNITPANSGRQFENCYSSENLKNSLVIGPEKGNIIGNLKALRIIIFDFLVYVPRSARSKDRADSSKKRTESPDLGDRRNIDIRSKGLLENFRLVRDDTFQELDIGFFGKRHWRIVRFNHPTTSRTRKRNLQSPKPLIPKVNRDS